MISGQVTTEPDMPRSAKKKRTSSKAPLNALHKFRTAAGLKITELAALADVSTKTINALEYRNRSVSTEMKYRVLNGLNRNPKRNRELSFAEVFPNDRST